jgi:hypothetical protein
VGRKQGGGSFAPTTGKGPRTKDDDDDEDDVGEEARGREFRSYHREGPRTKDDWERGTQDVRLFVSKRSIKRVSIATTRASISFPGRTRSIETKPLVTDASRQAAHSKAEPRASSKNLARPDAGRFLRPCPEAPRDLHGQVVRSTPVDAGPTNARHHPKTLQARRRIRVQGKRHRVFRGQKGDSSKE